MESEGDADWYVLFCWSVLCVQAAVCSGEASVRPQTAHTQGHNTDTRKKAKRCVIWQHLYVSWCAGRRGAGGEGDCRSLGNHHPYDATQHTAHSTQHRTHIQTHNR